MKIERIEVKPKFVPVIITLESQEEVDSLFAVLNHAKIIDVLPVLKGCWYKLERFVGSQHRHLWNRLNSVMYRN